MELVRQYVLQLVGLPYRSAGNTPLSGFDCSGLACFVLQAFGALPHKKDLTAQGLYDFYEHSGSFNTWSLGALAFFGENTRKITHVGILLDAYVMIEAGGGDTSIITLEGARGREACVRIRPVRYRKDFLCVLKPSFAAIGCP